MLLAITDLVFLEEKLVGKPAGRRQELSSEHRAVSSWRGSAVRLPAHAAVQLAARPGPEGELGSGSSLGRFVVGYLSSILADRAAV